MIEHKFDPMISYQAVIYVRMSSDRQNPRSPDQQIHEIKARVEKLGYPWVIVETYRDDAISGRYINKRTGLQKMLAGIRSGVIQVDLLLLDTLERLGRSREVQEMITELTEEHGVLVLTADRDFADTTSPQGEVFNAFEILRAREENRIKSYQVLRGKRDKARNGYWPGGAPPFGYRLAPCLQAGPRGNTVRGSKLEIDPIQAPIIRKLFQRAAETGHGGLRLAKWLSEQPEMSDRKKPLHFSTILYWLKQPTYVGDLVWERQSTDIKRDARVVRDNPESNWIICNDFCEPIVTKELFEQVQAILDRNRSACIERRKEKSGKHIKSRVGGLSLAYPLSGLVVCSHCGGFMRAVKSGKNSPAGRKYVYYTCDNSKLARCCANSSSIPESWLLKVVIGKIRERILGLKSTDDTASCDRLLIDSGMKAVDTQHSVNCGSAGCLPDISTSSWYQELVRVIAEELDRSQMDQTETRVEMVKQVDALQGSLGGWMQSLANPDLPAETRRMIEQQFAEVSGKVKEIEQRIQKTLNSDSVKRLVAPERIRESLLKLDEVLAVMNPSRVYLELARHIDRISISDGGIVELRLCRLGLLPNLLEFIDSEPQLQTEAKAEPSKIVTPRRRTRRKVQSVEPPGQGLRSLNFWATDPFRFSSLPDSFFETHVFQLPDRKIWHQSHAQAIAEKRLQGMSHQELATFFGCSLPTVRRALAHADASVPELGQLPAKRPRPRWHEENSAIVMEMVEQQIPVLEIASRLGKSDTTIRKAIACARGQSQG